VTSTSSYNRFAKLPRVRISMVSLLNTIVKKQLIVHLRDILNTLLVGLAVSRFKGHTIIMGNHSIIALAICQYLFPKNTRLIYHAQADEFCNPIKRRLISLYGSRFVHIFMTSSIESDFTSLFAEQRFQTRVLRHPMYSKYMLRESNKNRDLVLCLSSSFDHSILQKLVKSSRLLSFLAESQKMLVVRKSQIQACNISIHPNIFVVPDLLPYDHYQNLLERAILIVHVPNTTFHNRMSGIIVDAISAGVGVLAASSLAALTLRREFGSIINIVDSEADLIESLIDTINSPGNYSQLNHMIDSYDIAYTSEVRQIISSLA